MLNECIAQITLWKPQDCVTLPSGVGELLKGRGAGGAVSSGRVESSNAPRECCGIAYFRASALAQAEGHCDRLDPDR